MIDIAEIQTVIMSAGQPASRNLGTWLGRHRLEWRYGSEDYGLDHARNQNVRRFLSEDVPRGKRYLLMIDHDMVPIASTSSILRDDGPLVYCGYVDRYGFPGHFGDGDFGAACFRASADLLQAIVDPWFQTLYHAGQRVACECGFFHLQAKRHQAIAKMVGTIGHAQNCVLVPDGGKNRYRVRWSYEFE